jgi:hypothetical protein
VLGGVDICGESMIRVPCVNYELRESLNLIKMRSGVTSLQIQKYEHVNFDLRASLNIIQMRSGVTSPSIQFFLIIMTLI